MTPMANYYESDITRMIRELLQQKPEIADTQKSGRAQWWDKKLDPDMLRSTKESRVPPSPYAYQKTK
jgi:hypothetical protein